MTWASGKMYNFGGRQKSQFFFFHLVRSVTWSFIVQLYNPLKGCLVRIVSNVQPKKSAKKLLKWPKYRYCSDRLLEILKNFEKENIFFFEREYTQK